ncbi:MAG: ABC transporter substrate-binding protein [Candidatus Omnitrophica bacterium]|nr:ABC transporter substrate-binding protein [Candidatus Omnitrophota bacterium]
MSVPKPTSIRLGHSPDPDDAFMFYALAENKIPSQDFQIEHVIEDIESLNQRALRKELEVTAVSCHAYAYLAEDYAVMRSGSSVGDQYGPILVEAESPGRTEEALSSGAFAGKRIAVPGKLTTAFLVLQLFQKDIEPVFIPFDQIFDAVRAGKADYGLIIHEGQITFQKEGFRKAVDLGRWWHDKTGLPLPLGVDVIRRDLGAETVRKFAALFKSSIQYALEHRQPALQFAQKYGRGISDELNDRFVGMYVNHYTVDMGVSGLAGFQKLMDWGHEAGLLPRKVELQLVSG